MSKKAMISLPMAGKPEAQIKSEIGVARSRLESLGYEVVDTFFGDITEYGQVINPPLYFLAKSLEQMSHVTMVYFAMDGRMRVDVSSNMAQLKRMGWMSYMRSAMRRICIDFAY